MVESGGGLSFVLKVWGGLGGLSTAFVEFYPLYSKIVT